MSSRKRKGKSEGNPLDELLLYAWQDLPAKLYGGLAIFRWAEVWGVSETVAVRRLRRVRRLGLLTEDVFLFCRPGDDTPRAAFYYRFRTRKDKTRRWTSTLAYKTSKKAKTHLPIVEPSHRQLPP